MALRDLRTVAQLQSSGTRGWIDLFLWACRWEPARRGVMLRDTARRLYARLLPWT